MHNTLPLTANAPLAPLTTLGLGGPAQVLARPATQMALFACLEWGQREGLALWVLGGGSNVVIADEGLPGLVLQWSAQGRESLRDEGGDVVIRVDGGVDWDEWVAWTVAENLAGLECLSGIPGRVGAAPIQNIGAYGQEVCETFVAATVLDLETGEVSIWDAERCAFSYRWSALKASAGRRFLVLDVTFRLRRGGEPAVRYAELERTLHALDAPLSLALVRDTVLGLRRRKSMVLDPGDPNSRSAGSFFTNPVLSLAQVEEVEARLRPQLAPGQTMPRFPAGDGKIKLAAAWLIERSGFAKGDTWGPVGLSEKHALALVNRGGASARQVLALARRIQKQVEERTGVLLHPEPLFLGFPASDLRAFEAA